MSELLTYGATKERLIANGYAPVSVLSPNEKRGYRIAEDPAGALCMPNDRERRVVSLIVTAKDKDLRAAILGIIEKQLGRGPVRTSSDGSEHRPLRYEEWEVAPSRSWSPWGAPADQDRAVILEHAGRSGPGAVLESAIVCLSGTWAKGDLLSTQRARLPVIDRAGIDALFRALEALPTKAEPYVQPTVPADRALSPAELSRPRMAVTRSKRDLLGQPALLVAHMEAVRRGEEKELPDFPPEDSEAAPPAAPAPPSLLSRVLGR
jgi:hypothetical protein